MVRAALSATAATVLIATALSSWAGLLLLPCYAAGAVGFAILATVALAKKRSVWIRYLAIAVCCTAMVPITVVARKHKLEVLKSDWQLVLEELEIHQNEHGRPPASLHELDMRIPDSCVYAAGEVNWTLRCPLTPPFETLFRESGDARWYHFD